MSGAERQVAGGRTEWTRRHTPVLLETRGEFSVRRPLDGLIIGFRLHIEPTAPTDRLTRSTGTRGPPLLTPNLN